MFAELLIHFAFSGQKSEAARLKKFIKQFNHLPVAEVGEEDFNAWAGLADEAVRSELAFPDTAQFGEAYVRHCADGKVRAAGLVTFSGMGDAVSAKWFLVEFDKNGKAAVLQLLDNDPVFLKEIPQEDSGDTVEILERPRRWGYSSLPLFWRIYWPAVILIAIAMVLCYLLQ